MSRRNAMDRRALPVPSFLEVPMAVSSSHPVRHTLPWFLLAAALALLIGAPPGATQEAGVLVTGQVRDVATSAPVVNAAVLIPALGRTAYTDATGHFRMARVPVGKHEFRVVALGYSTLDQEAEVTDGDHLVIGLMPRPLALEALEVRGNRVDRMFRLRRNEAFGAVRFLGPEEMRRSGAQSVQSVVAGRIVTYSCVNYHSLFPSNDCITRRGESVPVRVFVDEMPLGGLNDLRSYLAAEIYAIEIWGFGSEVRVFTNRFVERFAMGRAHFNPRGSPVGGGWGPLQPGTIR